MNCTCCCTRPPGQRPTRQKNRAANSDRCWTDSTFRDDYFVVQDHGQQPREGWNPGSRMLRPGHVRVAGAWINLSLRPSSPDTESGKARITPGPPTTAGEATEAPAPGPGRAPPTLGSTPDP